MVFGRVLHMFVFFLYFFAVKKKRERRWLLENEAINRRMVSLLVPFQPYMHEMAKKAWASMGKVYYSHGKPC